MNPRPVLVFAKSTLIIALALIVMAGATGLSFKAHYCHNKLSGIAFYTELGLQKPASCGCKEDLSQNKRTPIFTCAAFIIKKWLLLKCFVF